MNSELQEIEERERQDRKARDMFAAAAFQGAMSGAFNLGRLNPEELRQVLDGVAEICWAGADAMMHKRGEP